MKKSMKNIPSSEQPYEKVWEKGPGALSNAELLAVIFRSGTRGLNSLEVARKVLEAVPYGGELSGLSHLSLPQLMEIRGIGGVKAVQIQCMLEFARRLAAEKGDRSPQFFGPGQIADFYMERLCHLEQEEMWALFLNTKNCLLKEICLTRGTVRSSLISPRELFLEALRYHAVYVVLMHNHPSGDPEPSIEDILSTKRIRDAGELLGIGLQDHIIVGDHTYVSLKERSII